MSTMETQLTTSDCGSPLESSISISPTPSSSKIFTIIVGLPGSGKSHLGRLLGDPFLDDWTQEGGSLPSERRVTLSDMSLLQQKHRDSLSSYLLSLFPNSELIWEFFANDPKQCWENIKDRKDSKNITEAQLYKMSSRYDINMDEYYTRPVWNLELKEFYELDSPCRWCTQCLEMWVRDNEGKDFVRWLWKLENEDR